MYPFSCNSLASANRVSDNAAISMLQRPSSFAITAVCLRALLLFKFSNVRTLQSNSKFLGFFWCFSTTCSRVPLTTVCQLGVSRTSLFTPRFPGASPDCGRRDIPKYDRLVDREGPQTAVVLELCATITPTPTTSFSCLPAPWCPVAVRLCKTLNGLRCCLRR